MKHWWFFLFILSTVRAGAGMVVSSHGLASEAGVAVLRAGGNAVDAAVATGMALAVVHPSAGNIGGGGFMLVRMASGEVTAFDFREKAPLAAAERMYLGPDGKLIRDLNHEGFLAVGVPGTVAGFDLARRRLGSKSWTELTAPAIRLAAEGFPLSRAMAGEFASRKADWLRNPAAAAVFLKPDGSTFAAGDVWRQPDLAAALRRIAAQGAAGFYSGETARLIAADMKTRGGLITEADLAAYQAVERRPLRGSYRGFEILSMPPPSSGGVALIEMLNMLEGDDLKAMGHQSVDELHLQAECMRRAFADRARWLGDPDFNPSLPVERLTSKAHAAALRRGINPDKASVSDPVKFNEGHESEETTHYSVIDRAGNAVVVTYTLEYSYGARLVADGAGFLYNNEMGDFNPEPGRTDASGLIGTPPNVVGPGKRMLSSMTPSIVVKAGKPYLLVGSPGGRTIINTVLQVIVNVIDHELPLPRAVAAGRIHHQWLPDELKIEKGTVPPEVIGALEKRGHQVSEGSRQGSVMAIRVDPGTGLPEGAADPRSADGGVASDASNK